MTHTHAVIMQQHLQEQGFLDVAGMTTSLIRLHASHLPFSSSIRLIVDCHVRHSAPMLQAFPYSQACLKLHQHLWPACASACLAHHWCSLQWGLATHLRPGHNGPQSRHSTLPCSRLNAASHHRGDSLAKEPVTPSMPSPDLASMPVCISASLTSPVHAQENLNATTQMQPSKWK